MKILVISSNYPSEKFPQKGTFVYKLIQEFVKVGNQVFVISPQKFSFANIRPIEYGLERAQVFRPKYLSFSNIKVLNWNTHNLTTYSKARVIKSSIQNIGFHPEVIYCHFIWSAFSLFRSSLNIEVPVVVAVGEFKNIDVIRSYYNRDLYNKYMSKISGFIAVSPQIRDKLLDVGISPDKIIVEPNGTDLRIFHPKDKTMLREKHGFPQNKKIVLFVGRFLKQKGVLVALEAINKLEDDVLGIFIGSGPLEISGEKILFCGSVPHHEVAEFMALSDIFVLPTLHEGSSNVLIEAMASGLPIVSSNIPEVRFMCDSSFSILVDPESVNEIGGAIGRISSDDLLRDDMSKSALEKSKKFDLAERALRILNFIESKL